MFNVKVCIGAGYGDEGKGMWTDYLVRTNPNSLVVRANGGAQVGHTVVDKGKRYIFSHLGSGTLRGAPTLFSRYAVINPCIFFKEVEGRNAGLEFKVYVERETPVTTPYDMMINQIIERERGVNRHGSTGMGFGVTLDRMDDGVTLCYADLYQDYEILKTKLNAVRSWCWSRLPDTATKTEKSVFEGELNHFIDLCRKFYRNTTVWNNTFNEFDTVIFENGQGLLLDQEYGIFPHVTRSNTGFRNIGKILKRLGIFNQIEIDVYYLSRCYTTRHGAGPMAFEKTKLKGIRVKDETNIPNEFQGTLRIAPLNLEVMYDAIDWDRCSHPEGASFNTVVTCCDQIISEDECYEYANYVDNDGILNTVSTTEFIKRLSWEFDYQVSSPEGPIIE